MKFWVCFDGENINRNSIRLCGRRVRGLGKVRSSETESTVESDFPFVFVDSEGRS